MLQTILYPPTKQRKSQALAEADAILAEELRALHPALRLKRSPRARRIALRLDNAAHAMNLVLPRHINAHKAKSFARQHLEWIKARMNDLPSPIPFMDGAEIPLLGRQIRLHISLDTTLKRTSIKLENNNLFVKTNKEDSSSRILRFLKKEALDTLTNLTHEKAAEIGKKVKAVSVRDTKSRWGSCAHDGKISYSWRLVLAPWEAMDYVVAHEVAHLVHMNHSKAFWAQCAALSTDYTTGKRWMREHGNSLMRYGKKATS